MGCVVSKSSVEPRTVTIKFSSCSNLTRRHSSPVRLAHGEHLARNPRTEGDHVVSLTSSTYGSLCLDTLPNQGEERNRATWGSMGDVAPENASGRSGSTENLKPLKGANHKQVGTINMWDGIENEKAALQVLRGLMRKPKMSRQDSGKRSPLLYHTLEDVDSVTRTRNILSQNQEFNPTGSSEVSRSQEFHSRARRDYSQSQSPALTTAASGHKEQSAVSSTSEASFPKQGCEKPSPSQDMSSQGEPEGLLEDPISSGYDLVTKAEVAEAILRSGSLSEEQARKNSDLTGDSNANRSNSWRSERRDSPPLDPELLASFEEALEMFTADDWCTVRIGESDDAAVTSGSTSDTDSPSAWLRESVGPPDNPAGDAKLNTFEILENHVEKSLGPQREGLAASKAAPLVQIEEPKTTKTNPLEEYEKKCPPGGEARCVLYTTSMRGIRKTFEDCSQVRRIVQCSNVLVDERDIAMHGKFRRELDDLVGRAAPVPRLFVRGRHIGGAEEVALAVEDGTLTALLQDLPRRASHAVCDGCGGVRFVPCATCCGSCKVVTADGRVACCAQCNENGLCRCPLCL